MAVDIQGNPIIVGQTKTYLDGFGNLLQSQVKSLSNNQVMAVEPVYDYLGQPALQTLPAPINSATFGFKPNFITNSLSANYSAEDFDGPNTLDQPRGLGEVSIGTLGWY